MLRSVEAFTRSNQDDVGLEFIVVVETRRVLTGDHSSVAYATRENHGRPIDRHRVPRANRTHLDDLAFDEFDSLLWLENPHLGHAVIVVDSEQLPCRLWLHK